MNNTIKAYSFIHASYFFDTLGLIFIVLKLCNAINWSLIWVLAPLWGQVALVLIVLLISFIIGAIYDGFNNHYNKKFADNPYTCSRINPMYWDPKSQQFFDENGVVEAETTNNSK